MSTLNPSWGKLIKTYVVNCGECGELWMPPPYSGYAQTEKALRYEGWKKTRDRGWVHERCFAPDTV